MFPTINLAQSGDTSAMGVERFDRDVLPFKPSYVIILIGSNSSGPACRQAKSLLTCGR